MKSLLSLVIVLAVGSAAFGQKFEVKNKMPRFKVVNKVSQACPCDNCICPAGVCPNCPATAAQPAIAPFASNAATCAGGSCATPTQATSSGWYPGKFLSRRRQ